MGARGKKPAMAARLEVQPSGKRVLPTCPRTLEKEGRALWRSILSAYPEGYFQAGDMPLLQSYCEEWERRCRAHEMLLREGEVITNERDVTKRNPWHDVLVASSNSMCQIATKLRICVNSRATYEQAAAVIDQQKTGKGRAGLMFGDERMQ